MTTKTPTLASDTLGAIGNDLDRKHWSAAAALVWRACRLALHDEHTGAPAQTLEAYVLAAAQSTYADNAGIYVRAIAAGTPHAEAQDTRTGLDARATDGLLALLPIIRAA